MLRVNNLIGFGGGKGFEGDINTSLLIHADGANASTSFIDTAQFKHTITPVGNAQIDTAQSVFGGASAKFDGTGDGLSVPNHSSLQLGSSDFTLDFWMRHNGALTFWRSIEKGASEWALYGDGTRWVFQVNGGSNIFVITYNPADNTWIHYACVRNGATTTMYAAGTSIGSGTSVNITDSTNVVKIGGTGSGGGTDLNGWLDEIRISKGIARWTSNFTPPTAPYS